MQIQIVKKISILSRRKEKEKSNFEKIDNKDIKIKINERDSFEDKFEMNIENNLDIDISTLVNKDLSSSKWNFEYTYPVDFHLSKFRLKGADKIKWVRMPDQRKMLKGIIINDVEDSNESLMLNQKRKISIEKKKDDEIIKDILIPLNPNEKIKTLRKKNEAIMDRPLFKSEGIIYEEVIVDAFDKFLKFDNEKFIDSFNRLESYKNSNSNIIQGKFFNIIIEKQEVNQESGEDSNNQLILEDKFVNSFDEKSLEKTNNFDSYKSKDDYYNKVSPSDLKKRKIELEEGMDYLNNQMKSELNDMKMYNQFEKDINTFKIRKDSLSEFDLEVVVPNPKTEERNRNKENKRRLLILSSCNKCFGGKLNEFSIISSSDKCYLSYPYTSGSITELHFILSSKEHINSLASVEEDIYEEIRNYMKSIVAFNLERDMSTVFVEFSLEAHRAGHFEIECVPIKHKLLEDARMYFKKAFLDQDYEWSTNKKMVDTVPYKGNLTKILNDKFSYVNVDFNAQGGFLHPIEDTRRFSQNFLREIFCPLLKKQSHEIKYPKKLAVKELIDVVDQYKHQFSYYDWTNYK